MSALLITAPRSKWVGNSNQVDAADSENVELGYSRIIMLDNETGARACFDRKLVSEC